MGETQLRHKDDQVTLSTCDNLLVAVWRAAPTVPSLKEVRKVAQGLVAEFPKGIALLHVASAEGSPRLRADAREQARANARENSESTLAIAHVVPVGGFAGAMARAFMSAVNLAAGADVPTKVFSSVGAASPWLAEKLSAGDVTTWDTGAIHEAFVLTSGF